MRCLEKDWVGEKRLQFDQSSQPQDRFTELIAYFFSSVAASTHASRMFGDCRISPIFVTASIQVLWSNQLLPINYEYCLRHFKFSIRQENGVDTIRRQAIFLACFPLLSHWTVGKNNEVAESAIISISCCCLFSQFQANPSINSIFVSVFT